MHTRSRPSKPLAPSSLERVVTHLMSVTAERFKIQGRSKFAEEEECCFSSKLLLLLPRTDSSKSLTRPAPLPDDSTAATKRDNKPTTSILSILEFFALRLVLHQTFDHNSANPTTSRSLDLHGKNLKSTTTQADRYYCNRHNSNHSLLLRFYSLTTHSKVSIENHHKSSTTAQAENYSTVQQQMRSQLHLSCRE